MSPHVSGAMNVLREFLFETVYHSSVVDEEAKKARRIVHYLCDHFTNCVEELPADGASRSEPLSRRVVDYIAGMTDQYALLTAQGAGFAWTPPTGST